MWGVFTKAGKPGWTCLIPVYGILEFGRAFRPLVGFFRLAGSQLHRHRFRAFDSSAKMSS